MRARPAGFEGGNSIGRSRRSSASSPVDPAHAVWLLSSFSIVFQKPIDTDLIARECAPPFRIADFIDVAARLELDAAIFSLTMRRLKRAQCPLALELTARAGESDATENADAELGTPPRPPVWAILLAVDEDRALVTEFGDEHPQSVPLTELATRLLGPAITVRPKVTDPADPDAARTRGRRFGFGWFIPELLKHKRIWREVLLASLVLQIMALGFPLFTQVIIDKVVLHHTRSTLIALAIGMAVFVIFTAALSWIRQYLVLHVGNRVDAVLGSRVLEHLFKLPPLYFHHRPTGVIAARMHGVEAIRQFVSSAAVTLLLDLPFLFIFVAVMLWYSVYLTFIVVAILLVIVGASLLVAPIYQRRLNEQFLRGAANQAFLTEYVAGLETVKSLQLEPQLNRRYRDLLAAYLGASFKTRQLGNTYGTFANTLEQLMTLLILAFGAYLVMTSETFTVGMLVAFQMFSARLSQPMLRLVGLWQQFQQARLSIKRLGDIMNAPTEPYRLSRPRAQSGKGAIHIEGLGFRYAENLPNLFEQLDLDIAPGRLVAVMGPSGAGKSTLAKLLQGFYLPSAGTIRVDDVDIRHLSANELRSNFGVVPQETTLFCGTILDNIRMANPFASFERIVAACRMAEIHATIESLPNGYETEIGERGAGLSGGQRQRLSIARALLKSPKVLIFDEATSGLDLPTAEQFGRTINALKGKVTILFIAHALPRTLQVDQMVRIGEKLSVVSGDRHGGASGNRNGVVPGDRQGTDGAAASGTADDAVSGSSPAFTAHSAAGAETATEAETET